MRSRVILVITILGFSLFAGCGGGSASAPAASGNPPPATVQGLTTPKSVSVVTAN